MHAWHAKFFHMPSMGKHFSHLLQTPCPSYAEMFGGGVMGSVMGNTLGRAVENMAKNVAQQVQAAQEQAEELHQAAEQAIKANRQVNQYLGGNIQLADPVSQSSSTQTVNGRQTQAVGRLQSTLLELYKAALTEWLLSVTLAGLA